MGGMSPSRTALPALGLLLYFRKWAPGPPTAVIDGPLMPRLVVRGASCAEAGSAVNIASTADVASVAAMMQNWSILIVAVIF